MCVQRKENTLKLRDTIVSEIDKLVSEIDTVVSEINTLLSDLKLLNSNYCSKGGQIKKLQI